MADDPLDEIADFGFGAAAHEDGAAVDADLVGHDEVVAVRSIGLRDALIQPQELGAVIQANGLEGGAIGPFLDEDGDVFEAVEEDIGQVFYGAEDQLVELILVSDRFHWPEGISYSSLSASRVQCTSGPSGSVLV